MRDILKSGLKVGISTLAGLLGWVVAGKVLALQLGAAGVGLYGLLRQLLQNLALVGSFNGQTSLVQGIATRPDPVEQLRFSGSVLWIQALMAGALALLLLLGAPWLGPWLIPHPQGVVLLRWLALAMLVMVAQTYVIGLLNGHRLINDLVKSQLWGPLAVLALVYPMVRLIQGGNPFGFVLMLAGPAAVITVVAARAAGRAGWLPALRAGTIHRADAVSFFRMSAVLLTAGIVTTGTQFMQSWLVVRRLGLAEAGQFWTAWTLSMTYVTLVLGSLGTYYMPSLSRLTDPEARRALIRDYLRLCLLAMPILVALVIVFKPWIIRGMFSASLLPALKIMRWMLIGDLFKGISWVLGFPMLAFSDMKWFFWSEVLFSLTITGSAWVWISFGGGVEGLGFLFMILYLVHMPVMALYVRAKHGFVVTWMEMGYFLGGLTLVLLLSAYTWRDEHFRFSALVLLLLLGGGGLILSLRGTDWTVWLRMRRGRVE